MLKDDVMNEIERVGYVDASELAETFELEMLHISCLLCELIMDGSLNAPPGMEWMVSGDQVAQRAWEAANIPPALLAAVKGH